jgi:hypothetical protein
MGAKQAKANPRHDVRSDETSIVLVYEKWPADAQVLFHELPDDILIETFEYLDRGNHTSLRQVNSRFAMCSNLANHSFVFAQDAYITCEQVFKYLNISLNTTIDNGTTRRLKYVDLNRLHIRDHELDHLLTICPLITALSLRKCVMLTSQAFVIMAKKGANLKRLDITELQWMDHFKKWIELSPDCIVMKLLEIQCSFSENVFDYIKKEKSLKRLTLKRDKARLESVELNSKECISETLEELACVMSYGVVDIWNMFPNLKQLIFITQQSYYSTAQMNVLNGAVLHNLTKLELFAHAPVSPDLLQTASNLKHLSLLNMQGITIDLNWLADCISKLESLKLGTATFSGFSILNRAKNLRILILDAVATSTIETTFLNEIGDQLTHLYLTGFKTNDNALIQVVGNLKQIESMDLTGTFMVKSQMDLLLQNLSNNPHAMITLKELNISRSNASCVSAIISIVRKFVNIRYVNIAACQEMEDSIDKIRDHCSRGNIILMTYYHNHYYGHVQYVQRSHKLEY